MAVNNLKSKVAGGALASAALVMAILVPHTKTFEGRSLAAYLDIVGVPTICEGITGNGVNGRPIALGQTATDEQCNGLLGQRLQEALDVVDNRVRVSLSPWQRAGLASFTYNIGKGAFAQSTLLKDLNRGNTVMACNRITASWTFIKSPKGGHDDMVDGKRDGYKDCKRDDLQKKCKGIVRRREAERELCLKVSE